MRACTSPARPNERSRSSRPRTIARLRLLRPRDSARRASSSHLPRRGGGEGPASALHVLKHSPHPAGYNICMDAQTLVPPTRRPRFRRASEPPAFRLTDDDAEIVRQLARHRFLRSTHIAAQVGRSLDRTNDRLLRLFHGALLGSAVWKPAVAKCKPFLGKGVAQFRATRLIARHPQRVCEHGNGRWKRSQVSPLARGSP